MIISGILFIVIALFLVIGLAMDDILSKGGVIRLASSLPAILILIVLSAICISGSLEGPKPEAIDVYRDKTELQINYKVIRNDTIPTDSIVIWK